MFTAALSPVKADVAPPPPTPRPPGPDKADIRGVGLHLVYTYWKGRRWMMVVNGCAPSQPACGGSDIRGCLVIGVDDLPVDGGAIGLLLAREKSVGAAPIKLMLDHCALKEIVLSR
jgi:hypothetical protein